MTYWQFPISFPANNAFTTITMNLFYNAWSGDGWPNVRFYLCPNQSVVWNQNNLTWNNQPYRNPSTQCIDVSGSVSSLPLDLTYQAINIWQLNFTAFQPYINLNSWTIVGAYDIGSGVIGTVNYWSTGFGGYNFWPFIGTGIAPIVLPTPAPTTAPTPAAVIGATIVEPLLMMSLSLTVAVVMMVTN